VKGYVSKDGKVGYRFFPKVACTTIKYALYEVEEQEAFSRQKYGFHIHGYINKRRCSIMDQCERRFVVIRDPIKRFLSAYGNRVTFHNELSETKVSKEFHKEIPFFNPTLDQFIQHFDAYRKAQKSINHHTKPLHNFLEGEALSYFTDIYKLEDLLCFEADLSDVFGKNVCFEHRQTGGKKFTLKDLSQAQVERLLGYYRQDYELLQNHYSEGAVWEEWESKNICKLDGSEAIRNL